MTLTKRIIWDQPERIAEFVASRVDAEPFVRYAAIGLERDGELVAGVVYDGRNGSNILMHVASDGSRHWATPAFVSAVFRYPFIQEGCARVTGLVRADNLDAQRLDEHLGFVREGLVRKSCADGCDLIIYGMLKDECRFLEGKYHAALLADVRRA